MAHLEIRPVRLPSNPRTIVAEIFWNDPEEIRAERRQFNISTYSFLRREEIYWNNLRPANQILSQLDRDEAFYFLRLFLQAKRAILGVNSWDTLTKAIEAIDETIAKTFARLNLCSRISEYIKNDNEMSEPDFSAIGTPNSHHTPEKTFLQPEYHEIKTIVVITKMLFPIFGEIIHRVMTLPEADNDIKEIMAFGVLNTLLSQNFSAITSKLQYYIEMMVEKSMVDDPMITFRGLTQASVSADRLARLIVKGGVNFDLYKEGASIIKLLIASLKRSVQNESSSSGNRISYKAMFTPEKGEDGRNISFMENEAHVLKEPLEVPIMVRIAVDRFIADSLEINSINPDVFQKIVDYYHTTTIPPTMINELLIGLFVADPIGSAYSVKYMNMKMFVKIIALMQIYAMKMGFASIVPLMSIIPTGIKKRSADDVDNFFITDGRLKGATNYFTLLKEQTMHLEGYSNFKFDDYMDQITTMVIQYHHTFNVSPVILELGSLGESKEEEGSFKYGKSLINEFYRFCHHLLTQATPSRSYGSIG